ncbi:MAG: hypothetical protein J6C07_07155 [Lachnospiraceae bacterium]|nr:hypothetical protein [Lachnospiraceae bacterium]
MQMMQRVFLIISVVIILGTSLVCVQKDKKLRGQWEQVLVENFLGNLCNTGKLTTTDYQKLYSGLVKSGSVIGIEIDEYRRETDINGNIFYYYVSWKEHEMKFHTEGYCMFNEGSIIRINIYRSNMIEICNKSYWSIIEGKESK